MSAAAQPSLDLINDARHAELVLHPIRRRILASLGEPDSATGLAKRLGLPRQKINYHLRELEREGFLELVEERQRRNCTERILRTTARSWVINPDVLGALAGEPEQVRDRFSSSYLVALAAKLIRDLATLRRRADDVGQALPTISLNGDVRFKSAADRNAFAEELTDAFTTLASKYHDAQSPDGRAYRFVIGGHPAITKSDEQHHAEVRATGRKDADETESQP